jgi:DNA replication protein DnaC
MSKVVKKLSCYDAVIIDDIGYVQHSRQEMEVLFTFLADGYERGSLMITINLPFSKWEQIFKDPMNAAAAIDRLAHHGEIQELNIERYRMGVAKKNKSKKPDGWEKGSK